ncbi:type I 3-dehydroquinate dehydratase [Oceanobacillus manasiensis]|uniref:type I 3-dehydroquinate dehydratase n=1 Tax=Oceanobacillus manasiensis TaxID=586413 RepID=UPI0005A8A594|nr:type I 3-dehydroquinate dehydratase [Oceanobacillus manasiensis]
MNPIQVRDVTVGEGIPKIIVPLMGATEKELLEEITYIEELKPDLLEWRADFFQRVADFSVVEQILRLLREKLPAIPLIFTFRTEQEGGNCPMHVEDYFNLLNVVLDSNKVDLIDMELLTDESMLQQTIDHAKQQGVKIILSNHEFSHTPAKETLLFRLQKMVSLGADISKIAVMPQSVKDLLTLLDVTQEAKKSECPLITMAMGKLGLLSRLSGEVFGSAATFAAGKQASAPGQISVAELRKALQIIHQHS